METIEIQVQPREGGNSRTVRRLRGTGKLPGIFYGPKSRSVPFEVNEKEFLSHVARLEGSHLIRMKSESPLLENKVALVKQMDFHPVTGRILHLDLYEVSLEEKIRVKAPLHFVGKAVGVIRGGILQPIVREIEVECLPMDIPQYLDVEVTSLDIGRSLHVKELSVPEGVVAIYETDFPLVTVVPPTVEKAPVVEAPEAVAEVAEVAPEAAPEEKKEEGSES